MVLSVPDEIRVQLDSVLGGRSGIDLSRKIENKHDRQPNQMKSNEEHVDKNLSELVLDKLLEFASLRAVHPV